MTPEALAKVIYDAILASDDEPYVSDGSDLAWVTIDGHIDLIALADAVLKAVTPEPSPTEPAP